MHICMDILNLTFIINWTKYCILGKFSFFPSLKWPTILAIKKNCNNAPYPRGVKNICIQNHGYYRNH